MIPRIEGIMFKLSATFAALGACLAVPAFSQPSPKVDFGRDIQPVFRQSCIGCHGPSQQLAGLRLDRKSSVFKDGARRVVPGSSENSFLFHRIAGSAYGMQMPPTGPLGADKVQLIKRWIDQGADWPETLNKEVAVAPLNPKAISMVETLRAGDRQAFLKAVAQDPKLLNARGPEGATPFMYAVLYGDAPMIEQLLKQGADPNIKDDTHATALMWAATNLDKTKVLLAHGAEVNVLSDVSRTPLMIAAGRPGGTQVVKLLLDRGANVNPTKNPFADSSPLIQAATAGEVDTLQLLLDHGAEVKQAGGMALDFATQVGCRKCVDLLLKKEIAKEGFTQVLLDAAIVGDAAIVRTMLDRGAPVNFVDPSGHTALMYAAGSDLLSVELVKLLIDRGADVNFRSQHKNSRDAGLSVLDVAKFHGQTPVVDLLLKVGAKSAGTPEAEHNTQHIVTLQKSIERSIPMIQRGDAGFTAKSGCISCHNNSIGAMAIGLARKSGFAVDEKVAAQQVKINVASLEHGRDGLLQDSFVAQAGTGPAADIFGTSILGYVLIGLDAEHYKADLNTDAAAMYLKARQMRDGRWAYPVADSRPPICSDYVGQTVLAMRSLQLYAPKTEKAEYENAIRLAAKWLASVKSSNNEDRVWKLLGLGWAAMDKDATSRATRDVLDMQRADGGWSDLASSSSTAYATGRALVALQTAGLPVNDAAFQKGVKYLLSTQSDDGTWLVKTRALAFQPYFETGFPHGVNQSMSSAGTGWATMALTLASQTGPVRTARVNR